MGDVTRGGGHRKVRTSRHTHSNVCKYTHAMTRCFSSVAEGVRFHRRSQSGRRGETLVSKIQLRWGQHSSQLRNARLERDVFAAATSVFLVVAFAARFSLRNVASIVGAIPPCGNRLRTRFSSAKFSVNTPLLTSPALLPALGGMREPRGDGCGGIVLKNLTSRKRPTNAMQNKKKMETSCCCCLSP